MGRPYGPLLAHSGYPGQVASFYYNPIVIICAQCKFSYSAVTILYKFGQICATRNALAAENDFNGVLTCVTGNALEQLETILCKFGRICATVNALTLL